MLSINKWETALWDKTFRLSASLGIPQADLANRDHEVMFCVEHKMVSEHDTKCQIELRIDADSLSNERLVVIAFLLQRVIDFFSACVETGAK